MQISLGTCPIEWSSALDFSFFYVDTNFLHQEFNNIDISSLNCIENWSHFLCVLWLPVARVRMQ